MVYARRKIMTLDKALIAVIIMALVTYIPRSLPIVIFRREIKSIYITPVNDYCLSYKK